MSRIFVFILFIFLSHCSKQQFECSSDEGRKALIKAVDDALSNQECGKAVSIIEPYYNQPGCGIDEIRLARASAYACEANINFFGLVADLGTVNLTGSVLWESLTQLFPSVSTDSRVTGGQFSLDSLFAIRKGNIVTPPEYIINAGTQHPGVLVAAHRTEDSNLYAMLVTMSLIGSLQNRYGAPDGAYQKTKALGRIAGNPDGWMDATFVDSHACTYASSVLSLIDTITVVGSTLANTIGGSLATNINAIATTYSAALDVACEAGCQGTDAISSGCAFPAGSCTPCPISLRNRNSCTSAVTDKNSCAAAGIINFINTNALGWQGPL